MIPHGIFGNLCSDSWHERALVFKSGADTATNVKTLILKNYLRIENQILILKNYQRIASQKCFFWGHNIWVQQKW